MPVIARGETLTLILIEFVESNPRAAEPSVRSSQSQWFNAPRQRAPLCHGLSFIQINHHASTRSSNRVAQGHVLSLLEIVGHG
jgi:hypothetical protein